MQRESEETIGQPQEKSRNTKINKRTNQFETYNKQEFLVDSFPNLSKNLPQIFHTESKEAEQEEENEEQEQAGRKRKRRGKIPQHGIQTKTTIWVSPFEDNHHQDHTHQQSHLHSSTLHKVLCFHQILQVHWCL